MSLANQAQDLASLKTDLSKANTQVEAFDIEQLKAKQQSAAALFELLNTAVGDLGLPDGSPIKTALHGIVGALVSLAAGGNVAAGAPAGAASELANSMLQQALAADPGLSEAQKRGRKILSAASQIFEMLFSKTQACRPVIGSLRGSQFHDT